MECYTSLLSTDARAETDIGRTADIYSIDLTKQTKSEEMFLNLKFHRLSSFSYDQFT